MTDPIRDSSVLIISDDNALVEALVSNNNTAHVLHARDSVQAALDEPALFDNNSIVIFDVGSNGNSAEDAVDQALKVKKADPTQVLILVGEREILGTVLKSAIQPVVFRAFPKPVSANQVLLALNSGQALHADLAAKQAAGEDISIIGPAENRTDTTTLTGSRNSSPAIFAALGIVGVAIVGWLIFGGGEEETVDLTADQELTNIEAGESPTITISATQERINEYNELAAQALLEGRVISPPDNNALDYYDQVLSLDAYDTTAYEGKKLVAAQLRESYNNLIDEAKFDEALQVVEVLQRIDPLNLSNDELRSNLQKSINARVAQVQSSGTSEEIAQTAEVLQKIEDKFEGSKSASDALKAEQAIVTKIDAALENDVLIPPSKDNAYALVSEALKSNSVSGANITPRVTALSGKLTRLANAELEKDNFDEVNKLAALIKRLNVNPAGLDELTQKLNERQQQLQAEQAEKIAAEAKASQTNPEDSAEAERATPAAPEITTPEIVRRTAPRYPKRALNRDQEGWVEVAFKVDAQGDPIEITVVNSEPPDIFDSAATRAVKRWKFKPAVEVASGRAVTSALLSTTLQFQLQD